MVNFSRAFCHPLPRSMSAVAKYWKLSLIKNTNPNSNPNPSYNPNNTFNRCYISKGNIKRPSLPDLYLRSRDCFISWFISHKSTYLHTGLKVYPNTRLNTKRVPASRAGGQEILHELRTAKAFANFCFKRLKVSFFPFTEIIRNEVPYDACFNALFFGHGVG